MNESLKKNLTDPKLLKQKAVTSFKSIIVIIFIINPNSNQNMLVSSHNSSLSSLSALWFLMSGFRSVCVWLCPLPVLSCSNGGDAANTLCLKPWGFSGVSAMSCCKVALLAKQICKFLLNFCCFSCLDTCLRCCSMFYNNVLYIYINVRDICVSVCLLSRTVDLYKGLFVSERRKTVRAREI